MQSPAWVPRLFQSRAGDIARAPWSWRTIGRKTSQSCHRDVARLNRCGALFFPQFANCGKLRGEHRELAFDGGDLLLVLGAAPRFLGALERLGRLRLVEVRAADRRVGEHRD